jgi:hypothetical protein
MKSSKVRRTVLYSRFVSGTNEVHERVSIRHKRVNEHRIRFIFHVYCLLYVYYCMESRDGKVVGLYYSPCFLSKTLGSIYIKFSFLHFGMTTTF